jgi:hypothetical protein
MPVREVRIAVQAAGALDDGDDVTKERARVATTRLARSAAFRPRVVDAYGEACVLCGISLGLMLEAAHLFPVNLPGSKDVVDNGIPLCLHHHALFDSHLLHISPTSLAVTVSPELKAGTDDSALAALLVGTIGELEIPDGIDPGAVREWLKRRYEAFSSDYRWVV